MGLRLTDLIDLEQITHLLEAQARLTGMPIGIIDVEGRPLVSACWQDICTRFHRVHPATLERCRRTEATVQDHVQEPPRCRMCANGLQEIAIPIVVGGEHLATLFLGQFLFEGDKVDEARFRAQAYTFGFDPEAYLRCLEQVPVFSWSRVEELVEHTRNLVLVLAEMGLANLKIRRETEERGMAQRALRDATLELDRRVQERTAELQRANQVLQAEIATRVQAEDALRRQEAQYRALFESASDAIFIMADGRFVDCNAQTLRIFGCTREQIIGHAPGEFSPPRQPGGEDSRDLSARYIQAAQAGRPQLFPWTHQRIDGTAFDTEVSLNRLEVRGRAMLQAIVRDLSERKRAEEALRDSEDRYRNLVERLNEGIVSVDMELRITFVNASMAAILGYTEDELAGKRFLELLDPSQHADFMQRMERRWRGGSERYEMPLRTKAGEQRFFIVSGAPLRDRHGSLKGAYAAFTDITERRQMEEALRESEAKFRGVVENMQDVFYRTDIEGRLVMVSPSGLRLLGFESMEEVLGTDIREGWYADPDQRDAFMAGLEASGFVENAEVALRKRDGTVIPVSVYSHFYFDQEGRRLGVEGVFFDITAQKQAQEALRKSEEKYRRIVNRINDIIYSYLPDGTLVFASESVKHLGYEPQEVVGHSMFEFIHPEDREPSMAVFRRTIASGKPGTVELRARRKDGTYVWLEERSEPILSDGKLVQVNGVLRDITERRRMEDALRSSEEKYRRIVDQVHDVLFTHLPDGTISFISESVKHMGYAPADILGRTLLDFVHPKDRVEAEKALDRTIREGVPTRTELRIRLKDGTYQWVEEHSDPYFLNGRLLQVNGVVRSITERKLVENALRESEARYRTLIENQGEGVGYVDHDENFLFVNPMAEEIFGVPEGTLVGMNLKAFLLGDEVGKVLGQTARRAKGVKGTYELRIRRPDGELRDLLVTATPDLSVDREFKGTLGIFRDITEGKRAEEALKRLSIAIEQATDSIVVTDMAGTLLYANHATENLTGYALEELLGSSLARMRCPRQAKAFYVDMWDTVSRGEAWRGRLTNRRRDGSYYETDTTLSPVRDAEGRLQYVVTTAKDVTRERELENQLRHSQRMEAIGVLAGGIAHDFNNLLTPVLGYAEMALDRVRQDPKTLEYLEEILAAGQRASGLVQQILTFSRQTEQTKTALALPALMRESLKLMRAALPSTIQIRQAIPDADAWVLGEPSQMHQVVMNLCTNAFHAMKEQGGLLEISLEPVRLGEAMALMGSTIPPGEYHRLRVRDTGPGMDGEMLKKIFLPFFTTKRVGEGTGLGLSIVHGIVLGMGGGVDVESEPGQGSTFDVYLPALREEQPGAFAARVPAPRGEERILVVDDDAAIAGMLESALAMLGYRVLATSDSAEALERFRNDPGAYDLVLSDMIMPKLTGLGLARELRRLRPELPVVLMTGFTERADEECARAEGVETILGKPVSLTLLAQTLRRILDSQAESPRPGVPEIA